VRHTALVLPSRFATDSTVLTTLAYSRDREAHGPHASSSSAASSVPAHVRKSFDV
jgi:hypothetical protein